MANETGDEEEDMEELIMLGTGYTNAVRCYNACFAIRDEDEYLLVDGGGGSGILGQLKSSGIELSSIHNIYLSQGDPESLFGVIWVIRGICDLMRSGDYSGELCIYCQSDLIADLHSIANISLPRRYFWLFDHRILFIPVYDRDVRHIMDHRISFFDMDSKDSRQLCFTILLKNGQKLVFSGKGLLPESSFSLAEGADWLIHEAYCLHSQKGTYEPYEKGHCTVRDACETASQLGISRLILTRTEDDNIDRRRELYTAESRLYYKQQVLVPEDLERLKLS